MHLQIVGEAPTHVLIVGGGIVGASSAYYLSKRGVKVTILEQSGVACHSSGKAAGFLAADWSSGPAGELSKASFALHKELAGEFGADRVGYRSMTCLGLVPGGVHQEGARSWLDKCAAKGSKMGTEVSVAQVHPRKLTEALVEASGAEIVRGRAVDMQVEDERVVGVRTESGEVLGCDALLLAMGAWSQQVVKWFPALKPLLHDTVGKKYTSVTWDAVCDNTAVFLDSEHQVEIYPRVDEVYANGCPLNESLPLEPDAIQPDPAHVEAICREVGNLSSKLAEAPVKGSTACFLPSSADGAPVMGRVPGTRNAYVACGHSYWGILNGPVSGKAMSELMVDGQSSCVSLEPFSPGREPAKCVVQ